MHFFRIWALGMTGLLMGIEVILFSSIVAWGQEDTGVEILAQGPVRTSFAGMSLDPVSIAATTGLSGGDAWFESQLSLGISIYNFHLKATALLKDTRPGLVLELEAQFGTLSVSGELRQVNQVTTLSIGLRTVVADFALAGRVAYQNQNSYSANVSLRRTLQSMEWYAGAGTLTSRSVKQSFHLSTGVAIPISLLTLSASGSLNQTGFSLNGGVELVLDGTLSVFADVGIGNRGISMWMGGRMESETIRVSTITSWDVNGYGFTSEAQVQFNPLSVFATLRADENSFSADIGSGLSLGVFDLKAILGVDQKGFKWVEVEVIGVFHLL